MIIFDDNTEPVIINSIHTPLRTEYMWTLDLGIMDYTLSPIATLEEVTCQAFHVVVRDFGFILPAHWNILVYDRETSQLDIIELSEATGREFTALVYGPNNLYPIPGEIVITNYYPSAQVVSPSLNKHQMLCHPISATEWCSVGPADGYVKYLKGKTFGDLLES